MTKKYLQNSFPLDQRIYLGITLILILFLGYYNWRMAFLGLIVLISLFYYSWETGRRRKITLEGYLRAMSLQVETAASDMIYNLPWGVAVLNEKMIIHWCNPRFVSMFPETTIIGEHFENIFPGIKPGEKINGKRILRGERWFDLYLQKGHVHEGAAKTYVLFVQEKTEEEELKSEQEREAPCIGFIQVDNYEEVLESVPADARPLLGAAIDHLLTDWTAEKHGLLQKYAQDRYQIILKRELLEAMQEEKFPIIDRVKDLQMGNKLPVTISCGFGIESRNLQELSAFARSALDLALGRGGNEVVIRDRDRFNFFGGKTKALEKRTKVKARVIAQALRNIIVQGEQVLVMGHQMADMDSIGAAVGIARAVSCLGKTAYIVHEETNPAVDKLLHYLRSSAASRASFITRKEALRIINSDTILVIADTHKPSLVAVPELLEKTSKVVVIDHHRRGEEFIAEPTLVYLEAYASSASELVTELLQYLDDQIEITPWEATSLLAGIIIDTKHFSYKAGVRTFEAAAFLRRSGADQEAVQRILQDDWETFVSRADIIKQAQVLFHRVAVAAVPEAKANGHLLAAQAADKLLTIEGIEASFVLCPTTNGVSISARSTGTVNVQVIMEKLGGGGHMTIAGAQIEGIKLTEARDKMIALINEYFA